MQRPQLMSGVFLISLPYFLRQDLSLNLELTVCLDCLAAEPPGPACLSLPGAGIAATHSHILMGAGDLNSDPQACSTSALAMEPALHPLLIYLFTFLTAFISTVCCALSWLWKWRGTEQKLFGPNHRHECVDFPVGLWYHP